MDGDSGASEQEVSGTQLHDKGETKMNIGLNAPCLGGSLALTDSLAQPVRADEWNKRTEFRFSAPVWIPGKVLAPGKYVFELADGEQDCNIVQVFSEDSDGNVTLVATLLAIADHDGRHPTQTHRQF
jgi:hypothetical protein